MIPDFRLVAALHAYPRAQRERDGVALLDLAGELIEHGASTHNREALGLVRAGLAARAVSLAAAPWGAALHRLAMPVAVALMALVAGTAASRLSPTEWPGWTWSAVLAGPALALGGLLAGRRAPLAAGALLLIAAGFAEGNGELGVLGLTASADWGFREGMPTGGQTIPLPAVAIPFALMLLLTAASTPRTAALRRTASALSWAVAGAVAVRLVLEPAADGGPRMLTLAGARLDPPALVSTGLCALLALAVVAGLARHRRAPGDALAAGLAMTALTPGAAVYGFDQLQSDEKLVWSLLLATHVIALSLLALQGRRLGSRALS